MTRCHHTCIFSLLSFYHSWMCFYHKCHNIETWNMLYVEYWKLWNAYSAISEAYSALHWTWNIASCCISILPPYISISILPPCPRKLQNAKKKSKHMKISQHQGQISIQTLSHSLPKWSITYKCVQLIFCVDHTLLWQHITALNQIARVHSPNTMSLMLLWKDWGLSLKKWVSWENATIMQLSRKSSGGSGNAAAAGKKNTKKGKKGSTHCLQ